MAPSNQLSRVMALLPWLVAHPDATIAGTATHFGISPDQVVADLNLLTMTGPSWEGGQLVDIDVDEDGYIRVLEAHGLSRPLAFTSDEATALIVGLSMLEQIPGSHDLDVLTGLSERLRQAAGRAAQAGTSVSVVPEPDPEGGSPDAAIVSVINEAIASQQRIHLRYLSGTRDEVTERDVDPMGMFNAHGHNYLRGWCYRVDAVRTFRVDRIESAEPLDVEANPPVDLAPLELGAGVLRPDGDPVRLELDPSASWVAEAYPVTSVELGPEGTTTVVLKIADREWAIRMILGLGGAARVLDSPALAAAIASRARAALASYR